MPTENTTNVLGTTENHSVPWERHEASETIVRIDRPEVFSRCETSNLRIELGHKRINRDEMDKMRTGSILSLDCSVSDPVAIYADGQMIGRGEVLAVDGKYGIRVVELNSHANGRN
jgi:flagellar motor switch protein FliN